MIHRAEHIDNFTVVSNDVIRDQRISDGSKCLLLYMLSCSDEWNFSIGGLAHQFGKSERVMMRLIVELKKSGYIEQKRVKDGKGVFTSCEWIVHETPIVTENHSVDKTTVWLDHSAD